MIECKSETDVLTKRGSRESHERTTQFTNWKKHPPQITQRSSVRKLKTISNTTETSQRSSVARKNWPAPFFPPVLPAIPVLPIESGFFRRSISDSPSPVLADGSIQMPSRYKLTRAPLGRNRHVYIDSWCRLISTFKHNRKIFNVDINIYCADIRCRQSCYLMKPNQLISHGPAHLIIRRVRSIFRSRRREIANKWVKNGNRQLRY